MATASDVPTLILFTRVPEPGFAKTRLIPALGAEGAAEFQWQMLADLLGRLGTGHCSGLWNLCVYMTKGRGFCHISDGLQRLEKLVPEGVPMKYQVENPDLGVRMRAAIETELAGGASSVGLMGSDVPLVTCDTVRSAFGLFDDDRTDAVLCPVEDGGYWFVGLRTPFPQLFEGMSYGGASVFEDALAVFRAYGRTVAVGPIQRDIDTPDDLAWFHDKGAGRLLS